MSTLHKNMAHDNTCMKKESITRTSYRPILDQVLDPAVQRLTWYKQPLNVLVVKKLRNIAVLVPFVQLIEWLITIKKVTVWVESAVIDEPLLTAVERFQKMKEKLVPITDGSDDLNEIIDFIICLGGDGTLLHASMMFQKAVPPVMAFHLGSLGFLTPFQFELFEQEVTNVFEGNATWTLRSRLSCTIEWNTADYNRECNRKTKKINSPVHVLNEVVLDRGQSSHINHLDLYLNGKHITSVQGDGLIISTPTGSTAYAVAAGASMIHPSVPAIMVTPICPHSLSFRPIVVPADVQLKVSISPTSCCNSWVSFDGRNHQELCQGDSILVATSIYPLPSICAENQTTDWFASLTECLHWNLRKIQLPPDSLSVSESFESKNVLQEN